jgi:hypothetical protein
MIFKMVYISQGLGANINLLQHVSSLIRRTGAGRHGNREFWWVNNFAIYRKRANHTQ